VFYTKNFIISIMSHSGCYPLGSELPPTAQFWQVHQKLYALGADERVLTHVMEPQQEPADVSYKITAEPPSVTEVVIHRPDSIAWLENRAAEVTRYDLVGDELIVSGRRFNGQWMVKLGILKVTPQHVLRETGLEPRRDVTLHTGNLHDNVIKRLPREVVSSQQ
jgi:hypothetical protein